MSLKKILAVVMASAMAIGAFAAHALTLDVAETANVTVDEVAVLADESNTITWADFVAAVIAGNGNYDGNGVTVQWSPTTGCRDNRGASGHTCTAGNIAATENTPHRINNNNVQYQTFGSLTNLTVSNVNFVFVPADGVYCANSGWAKSFTAAAQIQAEIQLQNTGVTSFTNCTFDKILISPWNATETYVDQCTFANVNAYALHWVKSEKTVVTDCTFNNCRSAIMIAADGNATEIVISGNEFNDAVASGDSMRGLIQFEATGNYAGASITIAINVSNNNTPAFWQLNSTVANAEIAMAGNVMNITDYVSVGANVSTPIPAASVYTPVALVNGKGYRSLQKAIDAATDGATTATVKLVSDVAFGNRATDIETTVDGIVFDLNGYTMTLGGDHCYTKNTTFKNGTIAITDEKALTGVFWMWNADKTLTFEDVVIQNAGNSINACSIFATSSGAPKFVLKNCTINLKNNTFNHDDGANLFYFNNNATNVKIEETTITIDRFARGLQFGTYDIDDSEITMTNMNGNAIRRADAVITNSTFIAENTENGMKLDSDNDVVIDGDSYVRFLGATNCDIVVSANSTVAVKDDAVLYADKGNIAKDTVTGNAVVLADIIAVDFVQVDGAAEGYDLYNINLVGANGEVINRLNSADLTFVLDATPFTGAAVNYEIIPVKNVTVTPDTTTPDEDRFMFNFKGKDLDVIEGADTAKVITIAQVKVTGYGKYEFSVDTSVEANKNNVVHATTISDNIVDTFVPGGAAGKGKLKLDDATTGEVTIVVPVRTLTVNVTFPNSVEKNDALYQDMKVEITGNIEGVHQTVTHKLGEDEVAMLNGGYVVTEARLVLNETYNIVVTGAGYRTARYTVTMTDSKTVNFWNNVKDNDTVVEEGKHSEKLNFLAGDIVGDNNINIYDLSAVVSYFATSITDEADYETYVKYDLNRDHVIDSKDVAYVLVSWGK